MRSLTLSRFVRIFSVAALLMSVGIARADDESIIDPNANRDQASQDGVTPQARGPVHEAFAAPSTGTAAPGPVVTKQPPESIEEMPPETKPEGDNVQWLPGYWAFDDEKSDFLWISGIWRVPPPGRQWVPGAWARVSGGWQWSAGFWKAVEIQNLSIVPEPPAPLDEASPPAPNDNSVQIPGGWVYRDTRYVWRPTCWVPFRAGWVWVPGYYVCTPCGYVYVEGYWDHVLRDRGLLFAPVCIDYRVIRPGWCFRPCYVVNDLCLLGSLFVRGDCGCYFFGDYYDAIYVKRGFICFFDVRIGRRFVDPLFAYYSHAFRRAGWERELRALSRARFKGEAPRPPRTLVEQTKVTAHVTKSNINQTVVLAPITTINKKVLPVVTLNKTKVLEYQKAAAAFHEVSRDRAALEGKLLSGGTLPKKHGDAPVSLKIDLSKTPVVKDTTNLKSLPPSPLVKHEDKPIKEIKVVPAPDHKDRKEVEVRPIDVKPIINDHKDVKPIDVKPPHRGKDDRGGNRHR